MPSQYSARTTERFEGSGTSPFCPSKFACLEQIREIPNARWVSSLLALFCLVTCASAQSFFFSTGNPDGLIGTASRPASAGKIEIESADDFNLQTSVLINQASFTGLLPTGLPMSAISEVTVEIYHIFPTDSAVPPDNRVISRVNSPSDVEIASLTRDSAAATLSFSATLLNPSFTVANSVVNGINPKPNQFTGGEGPVSGEEVLFHLTFNNPLDLAADHYFFVPQVKLTTGDFLWLSAPKPIVPPGTPFAPGVTDLQTWIRNADLDPDWSRVGTDITHGGPFNASFSLSGTVPESASTLGLLCLAIVVLFSLLKLAEIISLIRSASTAKPTGYGSSRLKAGP